MALNIKNQKEQSLRKRLEIHVKYLSKNIGDRSVFQYDKLNKSAAYIEKNLIKSGYKIKKEKFSAHGKEVFNIISEIKGNEKEIILIGAHYDTCYNPGADDNASAVAGLLELARILSQETALKRTVRFVAFVNEEPPFYKTELMGSLVHARRSKKKNNKIKAAIILEMIGYYSSKPNSQSYPPAIGLFYPNKGNFIGIVSDIKNRALALQVQKLFKKNSAFPVVRASVPAFFSGIDYSDHWSFWQLGYPAIMVTDTSFYRNKNYHTQYDTWDTLDYDSMAKVVKAFSAIIKEMANE